MQVYRCKCTYMYMSILVALVKRELIFSKDLVSGESAMLLQWMVQHPPEAQIEPDGFKENEVTKVGGYGRRHGSGRSCGIVCL